MTEKIYRKILFFGIAFIIAFSPLWRGGARVYPLTAILLIAYFLIFIWLWRANNSSSYKFKRTAIDIPIIAFAALALVSSVFSIYKHDSLYELVKLFCYIGVYYLIVNEFDRDMVKRFLYVVVGMGAVLSIYGFLQYLNLLDHSWWDPKEFIASAFVNHNHFAGYLELAIPVTAVFVIRKSSLTGRLLSISALIVMVTAFVLMQSRGAWVSLTASFLILIYLLGRKRSGSMKSVVILALLAAAVICLAYFGRDLIFERVNDSISSESTGSSFGTRVEIWRGALDMIRHNPITGTGIGTFIWGFPRYRPEGLNGLINFAHNDYLQAACEMGIAALFLMLWLIAAAVKTGMREAKVGSYRVGCAIGVLSLSIHGLSDFNFHIPANMLLFTIYLAVIMRGRD